jgi:hypothetical protein
MTVVASGDVTNGPMTTGVLNRTFFVPLGERAGDSPALEILQAILSADVRTEGT